MENTKIENSFTIKVTYSYKSIVRSFLLSEGSCLYEYFVRHNHVIIIRKTKCFRILERNAKISKTKRNFSRLYPTPQKFKKIDRLRRNEIHLKAVRTSS